MDQTGSGQSYLCFFGQTLFEECRSLSQWPAGFHLSLEVSFCPMV